MRSLLAGSLLILGCFFAAVTQASEQAKHVNDYREAIIKKCTADGQGTAVCTCAFNSWSGELNSKTSPAALAAARMLALPDNQTPNSNDLVKGVRLLQKMGIAISACADTANTEFSDNAYKQRLEQVDQTEKAIEQQQKTNPRRTSSQQVSQLIANMMPKVLGKEAGDEANSNMADLFRSAGRPDLAATMSGKKIIPDAKDLARMQQEKRAKDEKRKQSKNAEQKRQLEKAQLKARHKTLVDKFSTIDPQTRSVAEYQEVFTVNCAVNGFAKAMCSCNWSVLQATLGGRDDGAARTFTMLAAISSGNLQTVPRSTQQQAFTLYNTYGNLQNQKCRRYEN